MRHEPIWPSVEQPAFSNLPWKPSHSDFSRLNVEPFRYSLQVPSSASMLQLALAPIEADVIVVSPGLSAFASSLRPQATTAASIRVVAAASFSVVFMAQLPRGLVVRPPARFLPARASALF